MITKPDLGNGISHPARYTKSLLPLFAHLLTGATTVLDPFAGTGRIHQLRARGYRTFGVELEPEWATLEPRTLVGDALALPFSAGSFSAVCTSPTYGNRLADSHNAQDGSVRRSYTHDLGRPLSANNSGGMQWGDEYRRFHYSAWVESLRVLRPGGSFVLNIKDHVRKGERQHVTAWHVDVLTALGLVEVERHTVAAPSLKQGSNTERVEGEAVILLRSAS